ncbi:MAG: hypothetical protein HZB41_07765 [Ignavibacteriae bacterium]|nr:hypothetical protein [Ignavibacteriota bacterium]
MKQILILVSLILVLSDNCKCQQEFVWGTFYLGPFISHKAGINLSEIYPGEKKIIRINSIPDFGVTFFYLFSKEPRNTGLIAELGLSTYSFEHSMPFDKSKYMSSQTSCITLYIGCYFWGLSLGPTFGVPISRKVEASDANLIISQEIRSFFQGFNLSYFITLLEKNKVKLNLFANVHINITKLGWYTENDTTVGYESHYPASILSFGIGLNYLFKLGN